MTYTVTNFQTAKGVRRAFKEGKHVAVYQPGPFGPDVPNGLTTIEGPHYPAPHKWYLSVRVENGHITEIQGR